MRSVALAAFVALAFTLPADALAEPGAQGTYFCYWVDASKKQAATTALFRAEIEKADQISSEFAAAMRADAKGSRVYDCGWRRNPVHAEQNLDSLRAAYLQKGYKVSNVNWDPWIAER